jgi:23S rRNA pseudouridine1911/1915/1917 synthase
MIPLLILMSRIYFLFVPLTPPTWTLPHPKRTHQIRLHLAFLGCPIVGDRVYGKKKLTLNLERHFLHACKLKIVLPGEMEPKVFEAGLPEELQRALEEVRSKK